MGQPLAPGFIEHLSAAAARRLHGLGGDALGLLAWGLAQYGGPLPLVLSAEGEDGDGGGGGDGRGGALFAGVGGETAAAAAGRPMPEQQAAALARRRGDALVSWWAGFYAEGEAKWGSAGRRGTALMLVGLGVLDEAGALPEPPPGAWQAGALAALKRAFGKPGSWGALVAALHAAAGADADEPLPGGSLWFRSLLLEWGHRCGLEPPPRGLAPLLAAPGAAAALDAGAGGGARWAVRAPGEAAAASAAAATGA
jgi:hypothetical protein